MTGDCHVRFCEGLKGRFLGPTRSRFETVIEILLDFDVFQILREKKSEYEPK